MELFNTQIAVENLGPLLAGLLITIELTFVVIILSLGFALLVALGGMSRWPLLRWPIKAIALPSLTPWSVPVYHRRIRCTSQGLRRRCGTTTSGMSFARRWSSSLTFLLGSHLSRAASGPDSACSRL